MTVRRHYTIVAAVIGVVGLLVQLSTLVVPIGGIERLVAAVASLGLIFLGTDIDQPQTPQLLRRTWCWSALLIAAAAGSEHVDQARDGLTTCAYVFMTAGLVLSVNLDHGGEVSPEPKPHNVDGHSLR